MEFTYPWECWFQLPNFSVSADKSLAWFSGLPSVTHLAGDSSILPLSPALQHFGQLCHSFWLHSKFNDMEYFFGYNPLDIVAFALIYIKCSSETYQIWTKFTCSHVNTSNIYAHFAHKWKCHSFCLSILGSPVFSGLVSKGYFGRILAYILRGLLTLTLAS